MLVRKHWRVSKAETEGLEVIIVANYVLPLVSLSELTGPFVLQLHSHTGIRPLVIK